MWESALKPWQDHHEHQEASQRPESPFRRFAKHRLVPVKMVGLTVVAASETEQLALWIWQAGFRGDTPEPVRQLPVMLPGML
jgi:hypothetical protein